MKAEDLLDFAVKEVASLLAQPFGRVMRHQQAGMVGLGPFWSIAATSFMKLSRIDNQPALIVRPLSELKEGGVEPCNAQTKVTLSEGVREVTRE